MPRIPLAEVPNAPTGPAAPMPGRGPLPMDLAGPARSTFGRLADNLQRPERNPAAFMGEAKGLASIGRAAMELGTDIMQAGEHIAEKRRRVEAKDHAEKTNFQVKELGE